MVTPEMSHPGVQRAVYWSGRLTLLSDPSQVDAYDRVFAQVFGAGAPPSTVDGDVAVDGDTARDQGSRGGGWGDERVGVVATPAEQLSTKDFGALSESELAALAGLMRRLVLATPVRRTRRFTPASHGKRVDLRATLRGSRRTGGFPVRLVRRHRKVRRRRLVVLCDISGSMEPYARAILQLVYCAAGGRSAEVFVFATRLTRLTRTLRGSRPDEALRLAGEAAPDWSGGTRIGLSIKDFNDRYGIRGMARGAVVLVVSDGWDGGEAALLGREMARLSRVAYRIVWANPRTASPRYEPKVAGMAAAWPYCDAIVSAHHLEAVDALLAALSYDRRPRTPHGGLGGGQDRDHLAAEAHIAGVARGTRTVQWGL